MDYEVIDLSANGPRRGLLVALDCSHQVQPAPLLGMSVAVADLSESRRRRSQSQVYAVLTKDWLTTKAVAVRCGMHENTVMAALRRLLTHKVVERQIPARNSFIGKAQQEWRRSR